MTSILHFFLLSQVYATVWRNTLDSFFKHEKYQCSPGTCDTSWQNWFYANFILCTEQNYNLIVLEASSPQERRLIHGLETPITKTRINIDLYFMEQWNSGENVVISYEGQSHTFQFQSPSLPFQWPFNQKFCDNENFSVISTKITHSQVATFGFLEISSQTNLGMVAIKNVHVTFELCNYYCKSCLLVEKGRCTTCYHDIPDSEGQCLACPTERPYLDYTLGCLRFCTYGKTANSRLICQQYNVVNNPNYNLGDTTHHRFWTEILDPNLVFSEPKLNTALSSYFLGHFTTRAGTMIPVDFQYFTHLFLPLQIYIQLYAFGTWNTGSGVQILIGNVYYGALYYDNGFKSDRFILDQSTSNLGATYQNYQKIHHFTLILYRSLLPLGKQMVRMIGNLTNPETEAWGLGYFNAQSGYCHDGCQNCTLADECLQCHVAYRLYHKKCYREALCPPDSISNSTHCVTYDSEDKCTVLTQPIDSKYLVQAFYDFTQNDDSLDPFEILLQQGVNFQKGPNVQTSFTFSSIVLGGPYVLQQAVLRKDYQVLSLHYAITIHFTIIFGSAFPETSSFKYRICSIDETQTFVPEEEKFRSQYTFQANVAGDSDVEPHIKVMHRFNHNPPLTDLRVYFACNGVNNNLYDGYCAIKNYFIVVHQVIEMQFQCHPFCLACQDDQVCSHWGPKFIQGTTVFSQSECNQGYYFDEETYTCQQCDQKCLTCDSKIQCLECASNYSKHILDCECLSSQYDLNNYCHDCPQDCVSCFNSNACASCDPKKYKILINFQCVCLDGFYMDSNKDCLPCHKLCKACFGGQSDQCSDCKPIQQFSLQGTTCQCDFSYFFSESQQLCQPCHQTCLNCFGPLVNNCLECSSSRELVGLYCECALGTYSDPITFICEPCSQNPDGNSECQKECGNGDLIWFNQSCPSFTCSQGYENQQNMCIPVCGDGIVIGYEQCDDQNLILFDGCHNCNFQCEQKCSTCNLNTILPCSDVCGDLIVSGSEECEDGNQIQYDGCFQCKYQCQEECTLCLNGRCYECNIYGWKVDTLSLTCIENCGDSIVINREQCDDNNQNPDDACHLCRFQCHSNCILCNDIGDQCLQCDATFSPYHYYCLPTCGDGSIVSNSLRTEQCDDFNTNEMDGCSPTCQFQCQPSSICTSCINQRCQDCAQYYELYPNRNQCLEICGDAVIIGNENCEDLNSQMYDGCYKCRYQCHTNCKTCTLGICTQCLPGFFLNSYNNYCEPICGDKVIVKGEECDDGNLDPEDGCYLCRFQCSEGCEFCVKQRCLRCLADFTLQFTNRCVLNIDFSLPFMNFQLSEYQELDPVCGLGFYSGNQQIKGINIPEAVTILKNEPCKNHNQQCWPNFEFICEQNCQSCICGVCFLCKIGFFLTFLRNCKSIYKITDSQNDTNQFKIDLFRSECSTNCLICQFSNCLMCEQGWELNFIDGICHPKCGDQKLVDFEPCDDGNDDPEDGCHHCQLKCPSYCSECINNICMACIDNYYLTPNHGCVKVITCEETMGPISDKCLKCFQGKCLKCDLGWYETKEGSCETICGDGIHVEGFEICDDGNNVRQDGCYECQLECNLSCQQCEEGICGCTQQGWYLLENQCQPECGDEILVYPEQCDDGNEIDFDGCYNCQFQCDPFCIECSEGICYRCQEGLKMNDQMRCDSVCGDYLVSAKEGCDDGNAVNGDGCNANCQIEERWKCENLAGQGSQCDPLILTEFQLFLTSSSYDSSSVSLTFTKEIKSDFKFDWEFYFHFAILPVQAHSYQIKVVPIQEPTKELRQVEYQIQIQFSQELEIPQLSVELFENKLIDEYGNNIVKQRKLIKLQPPNLLSEQQRQLANAGSTINSYIIYGFLAICFIALITKNMDLITNLLDNLQQVSYLQFINVQFPENLEIYFSTFEIVSLQPLIKYLGFDKVTHKYIEYPYIESSGKLKQHGINSLFIANVESLMLQICMVLIWQFSIMLIIRYANTEYLHKFITSKSLKFYLLKIQYWCTIYITKYQKMFTTKLVQANAYDLLFASLLQLQAKYYPRDILLSSIICSINTIIFYSRLVLQKLTSLISQRENSSIISRFLHKDIFFFGLKRKKFNLWVLNFNVLLLLKKGLFCFFIIFFQNWPMLQIILISFQGSTFIQYLIYSEPFESKVEHMKLIITEMAISLSVLIMGCFDRTWKLKYDIQLSLGWFIVGLLSSVMIYSLAIDTYFGFKDIIQIYRKTNKKSTMSEQYETRQWIL